MRVYQGGTGVLVPLSLRITILDDNGETALSRDDAIGAASFDAKTRAVDEHVALPIDKLASGRYLLTIETSHDKATARRDVPFSVR